MDLPIEILYLINGFLCILDTPLKIINKKFNYLNKNKCQLVKYDDIFDKDLYGTPNKTNFLGCQFCTRHPSKFVLNSFIRFKKIELDNESLDLYGINSSIIKNLKYQLWDNPPPIILDDIEHYLKNNNKTKKNISEIEINNILEIYLMDELEWIKQNIREDMEYMYAQKNWYDLYNKYNKKNIIDISNHKITGFWFGPHWIEELDI